MIRFLFLITLICSACSISTPAPGTAYAMEELVLIEFAARLEEDYHRLNPNRKTNQTTPPPSDVGSNESMQFDHGN
jgi:hypothetical protein